MNGIPVKRAFSAWEFRRSMEFSGRFSVDQQIEEGKQGKADQTCEYQKEHNFDRSRSLTFSESAVEPDDAALRERKNTRAQQEFKKFRISEIL